MQTRTAEPMKRPLSARPRASTLRRLPLAAAAAAVLGLAACGDGGGAGGASQVAATVNGEEITVHQINHVLRTSRGVTEANIEQVRREILDRLIQRELLVQHAVAQALDHDPTVLQDLDAARRDVIARAAMGREADAAPKPDGGAVRAFYREHPDLFAGRRLYRFDEIRFAQLPDGKAELIDGLERAPSLREAVARVRKAGGDVAVIANVQRPTEHLPPAVRQRLASMKAGQLLRYDSREGIVVAELRDVIDAPLNEEQATPAIEQILSIRARQEQMAAASRRLREAATIAYHGSYERPAGATDAPAEAPGATEAPAAGASPTASTPSAAATAPAAQGGEADAAEAAAAAASDAAAGGSLSQGIRGLR